MLHAFPNPGLSFIPTNTPASAVPTSSATVPSSLTGSLEDLNHFAETFTSFAHYQADLSGIYSLRPVEPYLDMEPQKTGDDGRRGRSVSRRGSRGPAFRGGSNANRGGSISSAASRERHDDHLADAQSLASRSPSRPSTVERQPSQVNSLQAAGSNVANHDPLMMLANAIAQQQAQEQSHHHTPPNHTHSAIPPPAPVLPPYNPNYDGVGHTRAPHSLPPITNLPWPYTSSSSLHQDTNFWSSQNQQSSFDFLHTGISPVTTPHGASSSTPTSYHGFPFLPVLGPSVPQNVPLNTQLIYLQLQQQALTQAHQHYQEQLARAQSLPSLLTQQRPASLHPSPQSTAPPPTVPAASKAKSYNPVRLSASAPEPSISVRSGSSPAESASLNSDINEDKRRRNTAASARFRIKKKQRHVELHRSISDLEGRALDLEKEAEGLRRENTWLKEMVILKGKRNMEILQAYSVTSKSASNGERPAGGNTTVSRTVPAERDRAEGTTESTSEDDRHEEHL